MKNKISKCLASALGITLSISVCLMGIHAKDLAAYSKTTKGSHASHIKKMSGDDQAALKIHHDPHNHVDHQTSKSIVKVSGDQTQMNADARSLRKVRHGRRKQQQQRRLNFRLILVPFGAAS